jgi:hypothetical protein
MRIVRYFRQAGFVSLALTVASMMLLPDGFIWFVLAVYLAVIVWGCDVVFGEMRDFGLPARLLASLPFLIVAVWFSFQFVFLRLPLDIGSRNPDADYPDNTAIAGINWNRKFADLRVTISNDTEYDYTNLNLLLKPKEPVVYVAQVTTLPGVSILRESDVKSTDLFLVNPSTQERQRIPNEWFASTGGFRVECDRLPPHEHIEIVLATVTINQSRVDKDPGYVGGPFTFTPKGHPEDAVGFWYRWTDRPLPDDIFGDKPKPESIKIAGQYTAFHRRSYVSEDSRVMTYFFKFGMNCCAHSPSNEDANALVVMKIWAAVLCLSVFAAPISLCLIKVFDH